jgi:N-methylhydantoinase A/oxoprolinase/acetone carboxylase beta subunit
MRIGIGIDTGGTCTDAVAYDYESDSFLAKGKSLTTREDLSIGIGKALDAIPPEYIREAVLVALSTTLATNASLEDKGGRAKLVLFGSSRDFVQYADYDLRHGLKRDSYICVNVKPSYNSTDLDEPDWESWLKSNEEWLRDADALSAAELFHSINGAQLESKFKKFAEPFGVNVTCANELAGAVNIVSDGATALLNGKLLPIMNEFVAAAIGDFAKRGCTAPIMVVRSDGTLMASDFAKTQPVETILSGPAASVLAGKSFTDSPDYVIIDMGGTSTDISAVYGGKTEIDRSGIRLGNWRTCVQGVQVTPFALGGDTTIRLKDYKALELTTRKATPMCVAAQRWPEIKEMLRGLLSSKHINKYPLQEIYYLVREPSETKNFSDDEILLLSELRKGPVSLHDLERKTGLSLYFFDSERLESEGIVMRCALTPTDFMHLKGDYAEFDREGSELAAKYILFVLDRMNPLDKPRTMDSLVDEAYELVEGHIYQNLASILLQKKYPYKFSDGIDEQTKYLIQQAWYERGDPNALLAQSFHSQTTLIGVGAPTHVFLPAVAKALHAPALLPEHANVANALGALMATINVEKRVEISKIRTAMGEVWYVAHLPSGNKRFDRLADALLEAEPACIEALRQEARSRGAKGELDVHTRTENRGEFGSVVVSEVEVKFGQVS